MPPADSLGTVRAAPWIVVLSAVVACADDGPSGTRIATTDASSSTSALVDDAAAPVATTSAATVADERPPRPGPYRARGEAAVRANATCEGCHVAEAQAWRASRHRSAETNPAYRRAFGVEPSTFCRGCHAPEAPLALDPGNPTRPPERAIAELGVGCVTCHVEDEGTVLAAPRRGAGGGAAAGPPPHAVLRSADFGQTGACAACHEFAFPGLGDHTSLRKGGGDGAFMQTTLREHAASVSSDRPCASCHMPKVLGGASHGFGQTRDPVWLKSSVHATATVGPVGAAVVALRAANVGHAMPTGDLFRRLEVGAERLDARGRVVQRDVRWLARHFEVRGGEPGRTLVRDDRLRDVAVEIDLDVACPTANAKGERVRWWVTYQRVAETHRGDDPATADVESEVLLHEGSLCNDREAP